MMNETTIRFHLENMEKGNRFPKHRKELQEEIDSLKAVALKFKNTPLGLEADLKAKRIESRMLEIVGKVCAV